MKKKKGTLFLVLCLLAVSSLAARETHYRFNFTNDKHTGSIRINPQTIYGKPLPYGYDLGFIPGDGKPFFFSVELPEGNYLVKLRLGNDSVRSVTTVKAESRRLMLEKIETDKGSYREAAFMVNLRNTKIGDTDSVRIKPREIGKLIWDNKLTLEFNGTHPSVAEIEVIRKDPSVTIFLAGNSTVVDEAEEPWSGWGQLFPRFFTSDVAIANYAESGEAANTFVSSKRFAKLLTKIKKGDYLFIEFGHNDEKQKGEGQGPYTSYKNNLKLLIREAKGKGALPVLVTSMHRRFFDENGKVINTHGDYPDAARQTAREEQIPLIDLNAMSKILYEAWGPEGSKRAFVHFPAGTFPNQSKPLEDNTHFNPYGGYEIARCILKGIVDNRLPIRKYIRDEFKSFDPAHPDDVNTFSLPQTPFFSSQKPDGN